MLVPEPKLICSPIQGDYKPRLHRHIHGGETGTDGRLRKIRGGNGRGWRPCRAETRQSNGLAGEHLPEKS